MCLFLDEPTLRRFGDQALLAAQAADPQSPVGRLVVALTSQVPSVDDVTSAFLFVRELDLSPDGSRPPIRESVA